MPTTQLDADQLRRLRIAAQRFAGTTKPRVEAVLEASGPVRTLGGVEVYVALAARVPDLRRAAVDRLVAARKVMPLPGARGCMYLTPESLAPLCVRFADGLRAGRDRRDQQKAGIRPGEVEQLAALALETLRAQGPMTTDGLRRALPAGSVRSLGEVGKKVGISSPLPAALRRLEFAGDVVRAPIDHRLDTEQYLWTATDNAFAGANLPADAVELHAALLAVFLSAAGVATLASFAEWAGIPQRDAKAALAVAPHEVVATAEGDQLAGPALAKLTKAAARADDAVALLPFEDNLTHLHGAPAWLIEPRFHGLEVMAWGSSKKQPLGTAAHSAFRTVLADGRLRGFWEFDPDRKAVRLWWFDPPRKATVALAAERAEQLTVLLRDDLGHAHSFSLDTDVEIRHRIDQLEASFGKQC